MEDREKLAIAQALYSGVAGVVSTKDPESLRAKVDAEYRAMYETCGARTFDMTVNGAVVGTYTVKTDKVETVSRSEFVVDDRDGLDLWLGTLTKEELLSALDKELFAQRWFELTGECPEGCSFDRWEEEKVTKGKGGTLKIDQQKVLDALGKQLPKAMGQVLLIGGAE